MKLEYVILAVLMAAAAVTAVIHFGQGLNQQTAVAAQATAGRTTQAKQPVRDAEESAPASSRRINGARDEDAGDSRASAGTAEPLRESGQTASLDSGEKRGAESLVAQRRTTLRDESTAAPSRDGSRSRTSDEATTRGNLLWLVPVVLIVGAGLVYVLSSRVRN